MTDTLQSLDKLKNYAVWLMDRGENLLGRTPHTSRICTATSKGPCDYPQPAYDEGSGLGIELTNVSNPKIVFMYSKEVSSQEQLIVDLIHNISKALGYTKIETEVARFVGKKANELPNSIESEFASEKLNDFIEEGCTKIVVMGARTLALTHPSWLFSNVNNDIKYDEKFSLLVTWSPQEMLDNPILKRDCWLAIRGLKKPPLT